MHQVLVIDDHRQIREMASRLLAGRYDVTLRADALDIVADFERLHQPVVVLDISLPTLDGFAAARLLKRRHPEAKIVFFSSDPNPRTVQEAFALGGSAYVVNTLAVAELIPAIEAAIDDSVPPL